MIERRPRAIYAIIDIAEYIGQRSPAVAERFMDATEETFSQLEKMPGLGHLYQSKDSRLAAVRVWAVKEFPNHLVFYRSTEKAVEILHIIHDVRDLDNELGEELLGGDL